MQHFPPMSWPCAGELKAVGCPNPCAVLPSPAKEKVVALLRELAPELALLGVTKVALFGSVARGEDSPASDIAVSTVNPRDGMLRAYARDLATATSTWCRSRSATR